MSSGADMPGRLRRLLDWPPIARLQGRFGRGVMQLGGGTVLGQAVVLLAMPAITRLYTPADMGLLGLVVVYLNLGVILGARYDLAIVAARDDREADCLLTISLLAVVPLTLLAVGGLAALIHFDLLAYGRLPLWSLTLVAPALLMTGVFSVLRFWHVRAARYGNISLALVAQGIGRAVVPVGLGLWRVGWFGLLLGEIAGRLLGVGRLGRIAWPAVRRILHPFDGAYIKRILADNWKYPSFALPSALLDVLGAALPLPLVARFYGNAAAGEYLLVLRLVSLPAGLVGSSVADVFHSRLAELYRIDPAQIRTILSRVSRQLLLIGLAIFLPAAVAAPWVFGLIFGQAWMRAGWLLAIMAPLAVVALVVSPISRLLPTLERQRDKLLADAAMVVAPLAGLITGWGLELPFLGAMAVCSACQFVAYVLYYALIWRVGGVETK